MKDVVYTMIAFWSLDAFCLLWTGCKDHNSLALYWVPSESAWPVATRKARSYLLWR